MRKNEQFIFKHFNFPSFYFFFCFFSFLAGRTWTDSGLKRAQVQYLSAEMWRTKQQREQMRNSEAVFLKSDERATRLLQIEEERAKREEERAKREEELHKKQMTLLDLKIKYYSDKN